MNDPSYMLINHLDFLLIKHESSTKLIENDLIMILYLSFSLVICILEAIMV